MAQRSSASARAEADRLDTIGDALRAAPPDIQSAVLNAALAYAETGVRTSRPEMMGVMDVAANRATMTGQSLMDVLSATGQFNPFSGAMFGTDPVGSKHARAAVAEIADAMLNGRPVNDNIVDRDKFSVALDQAGLFGQGVGRGITGNAGYFSATNPGRAMSAAQVSLHNELGKPGGVRLGSTTAYGPAAGQMVRGAPDRFDGFDRTKAVADLNGQLRAITQEETFRAAHPPLDRPVTQPPVPDEGIPVASVPQMDMATFNSVFGATPTAATVLADGVPAPSYVDSFPTEDPMGGWASRTAMADIASPPSRPDLPGYGSQNMAAPTMAGPRGFNGPGYGPAAGSAAPASALSFDRAVDLAARGVNAVAVANDIARGPLTFDRAVELAALDVDVVGLSKAANTNTPPSPAPAPSLGYGMADMGQMGTAAALASGLNPSISTDQFGAGAQRGAIAAAGGLPASGLGPSTRNPDAPPQSPERPTDWGIVDDGIRTALGWALGPAPTAPVAPAPTPGPIQAPAAPAPALGAAPDLFGPTPISPYTEAEIARTTPTQAPAVPGAPMSQTTALADLGLGFDAFGSPIGTAPTTAPGTVGIGTALGSIGSWGSSLADRFGANLGELAQTDMSRSVLNETPTQVVDGRTLAGQSWGTNATGRTGSLATATGLNHPGQRAEQAAIDARALPAAPAAVADLTRPERPATAPTAAVSPAPVAPAAPKAQDQLPSAQPPAPTTSTVSVSNPAYSSAQQTYNAAMADVAQAKAAVDNARASSTKASDPVKGYGGLDEGVRAHSAAAVAAQPVSAQAPAMPAQLSVASALSALAEANRAAAAARSKMEATPPTTQKTVTNAPAPARPAAAPVAPAPQRVAVTPPTVAPRPTVTPPVTPVAVTPPTVAPPAAPTPSLTSAQMAAGSLFGMTDQNVIGSSFTKDGLANYADPLSHNFSPSLAKEAGQLNAQSPSVGLGAAASKAASGVSGAPGAFGSFSAGGALAGAGSGFLGGGLIGGVVGGLAGGFGFSPAKAMVDGLTSAIHTPAPPIQAVFSGPASGPTHHGMTGAPGWGGEFGTFGGYGAQGGPMGSGFGKGEAFGPGGAFSDVTGGYGDPAMNGGLGSPGGWGGGGMDGMGGGFGPGEANNNGPGIW